MCLTRLFFLEYKNAVDAVDDDDDDDDDDLVECTCGRLKVKVVLWSADAGQEGYDNKQRLDELIHVAGLCIELLQQNDEYLADVSSVTNLIVTTTPHVAGSNPTRGKSCVTTLGKLFTPMCLCHQTV